MDVPKPPEGVETAGKRLWQSVVEEFELAEHELALLRQAVRVADVCDELERIVRREGVLVNGRPHGALVEARQQRILLARLVTALRVPLGDEDAQRTQFRGTRGFYGPRAVS